jgi:IclR family transcriptional regulator, KDG regulon repressor
MHLPEEQTGHFYIKIGRSIRTVIGQKIQEKRVFPIKSTPSKSKIPSPPVSKYRVTSLDKALSIVELMLNEDRDFSITEISQKLRMGKGTVHRIVSTLKAHNFLQQDGNTKLYSLGVRTLEIGAPPKKEKFLRKTMAPFLMECHDKCGETVNAAVWEYNEMRYIYRLESQEMLRIAAPYGHRFPGYCSATGKLFLSYLSNEDIRHIYGRKNALKKLTERTIDSIEELILDIEKVRIKKVAIDDEEAIGGVYCVGAPVLNSKGECIAAVSISAPKNRLSGDIIAKFTKLISETARKITHAFCEPQTQKTSYN